MYISIIVKRDENDLTMIDISFFFIDRTKNIVCLGRRILDLGKTNEIRELRIVAIIKVKKKNKKKRRRNFECSRLSVLIK